MPREMEDPDGDDSEFRSKRYSSDTPPRPWWRPASTFGRVFLGTAVLAVITAIILSIVFVKNFLERDARFRIAGTSNIQATGLTEVSRADMLPVFGEDIGRNIFFVPLGERRKQLEQIPWVEHATVMRLLPDQIRVSVVERKPVAFVRQGSQIGLVDGNGVLLSMPAATMTQHHYSFPVVTGIDARDPLTSRKARMAVYQRLIGELDANGQHLSEQISEIDLPIPKTPACSCRNRARTSWRTSETTTSSSAISATRRTSPSGVQQYPKLAAVDLRYEQQVVLEMTPGANAAHHCGQRRRWQACTRAMMPTDQHRRTNPAQLNLHPSTQRHRCQNRSARKGCNQQAAEAAHRRQVRILRQSRKGRRQA